MTKYEKAKNNSKKIKFAEILFVRILLTTYPYMTFSSQKYQCIESALQAGDNTSITSNA